jgi:hypothetical protein
MDIPLLPTNVSSLITVFTAVQSTSDPLKAHVQLNTLRAWTHLRPQVRCVPFTEDPAWARVGEMLGMQSMIEFPTNVFGTPLFFEGLQLVETVYGSTSTVVGYANADILFDDTLSAALEVILEQQAQQVVQRKFLVVGRRHNIAIKPHMVVEPKSRFQASSPQVKLWAEAASEQFLHNAQDYFFVPANANVFPKEDDPDLVIGRLGYDNWVVDYAFRQPDIDLIDVSGTVRAVHQTESTGNWASSDREDLDGADRDWNIDRINKNLGFGYTFSAAFETYYDASGALALRKRNIETTVIDRKESYGVVGAGGHSRQYWIEKFAALEDPDR